MQADGVYVNFWYFRLRLFDITGYIRSTSCKEKGIRKVRVFDKDLIPLSSSVLKLLKLNFLKVAETGKNANILYKWKSLVLE